MTDEPTLGAIDQFTQEDLAACGGLPQSIIIAAWIKDRFDKGTEGEVPCPMPDCDGTLRYSIAASNGHAAGFCKCVRFME